jgi:hypothetical protein
LNLGRLVWSLWALKIIVQSTELGGDRYLGELVTLFSLFPANETCEPGKLVPSGTMRSRRRACTGHVLGACTGWRGFVPGYSGSSCASWCASPRIPGVEAAGPVVNSLPYT